MWNILPTCSGPYNPEDQHQHLHCHENVKSHTVITEIIIIYRNNCRNNHKSKKAVLLHTMEALVGRGCIAPTHS
jgi:hypothetical protein